MFSVDRRESALNKIILVNFVSPWVFCWPFYTLVMGEWGNPALKKRSLEVVVDFFGLKPEHFNKIWSKRPDHVILQNSELLSNHGQGS